MSEPSEETSALVLGATGLVGAELVRQLLGDPEVSRVVTLVRRSSGARHLKLDERVVDFARLVDESRPYPPREGLAVDVLFSAIGTTRKQAGSLEAQRRVDYELPLAVARLARAAGARTLALVSSTGASPTSWSAYLRMKGELDRDVEALGYERVRIVRPGMLDGERPEARPMERLGIKVMRVLGRGPLAAQRPVTAGEVARALRRAVRDPAAGTRVLEASELFDT
jgi:uncharacterized protein YbjT (DUF2867 family)